MIELLLSLSLSLSLLFKFLVADCCHGKQEKCDSLVSIMPRH